MIYDYKLLHIDYRDDHGRTLSDWLKRVDMCKDTRELATVGHHFIESVEAYPLIYVSYACEHIDATGKRLYAEEVKRFINKALGE